jgi:hypothetical protein
MTGGESPLALEAGRILQRSLIVIIRESTLDWPMLSLVGMLYHQPKASRYRLWLKKRALAV